MEYFHVPDMELKGPIGEFIYKWPKVKEIRMENNEINGKIPEMSFGSASLLELLDFTGNKLTGDIPASLGGLQSLKFLGLGSNALEGFIPNSFGNLGNLSKFWILN